MLMVSIAKEVDVQLRTVRFLQSHYTDVFQASKFSNYNQDF